MLDDEQTLMDEAERYIKDHKQELIKLFADPDVYRSDEHPLSLFMAGSPGAGKTEVSKRLIDQFEGNPPVRIDADEIRPLFPNYTGGNSHIFQSACTIGVHKLFDYVIDHNFNVILDGTFAYGRAMDNIERSLKHGRRVIVWYLYQDPIVAWKFAKIREIEEGRRVPKDVFISAFVRAQENANLAKVQFGQAIELNMIIKDFEKDTEEILLKIDSIDKYLPRVYSKEELENIL